jgi:hypothetical protein
MLRHRGGGERASRMRLEGCEQMQQTSISVNMGADVSRIRHVGGERQEGRPKGSTRRRRPARHVHCFRGATSHVAATGLVMRPSLHDGPYPPPVSDGSWTAACESCT